MERQQKPCVQCGELVDIVPAGISKKSGKPYGSFAKCKRCGFSEQLGQKKAAPSNEGVALLRQIKANTDKILDIILPKGEQNEISEEDLPFN